VLPASLEIRLKPERRQDTAAVVERLGRNQAFGELHYAREWLERFEAFLLLLRTVGAALGGFLVLAALVIVTNTIKLTLYARQDELEAMTMVGATSLFIKLPYLIEGALAGVVRRPAGTAGQLYRLPHPAARESGQPVAAHWHRHHPFPATALAGADSGGRNPGGAARQFAGAAQVRALLPGIGMRWHLSGLVLVGTLTVLLWSGMAAGAGVDLEASRRELTSLQKQIEETLGVLRSKRAAAGSLAADLERLDRSLEQLRELIGRSDRELAELDRQLTKSQADLELLRRELAATERLLGKTPGGTLQGWSGRRGQGPAEQRRHPLELAEKYAFLARSSVTTGS